MNRIPHIEIQAPAFLTASIALLLVPFKWFVSAFFAALLHEIGHLLALLACRVPVRSIVIGSFGAKIITGYQSNRDQLLCAAAGPLAGLLASMLLASFPLFSICCMGQSVFNLLPFYPMDGGRVLMSSLRLILREEHAIMVFRIIQWVLLALIFGLTIHEVVIN